MLVLKVAEKAGQATKGDALTVACRHGLQSKGAFVAKISGTGSGTTSLDGEINMAVSPLVTIQAGFDQVQLLIID